MKETSHVGEDQLREATASSKELTKAEVALRYATISMVGAWIGFLAWAPRPDLLISQAIKDVQTLVK